MDCVVRQDLSKVAYLYHQDLAGAFALMLPRLFVPAAKTETVRSRAADAPVHTHRPLAMVRLQRELEQWLLVVQVVAVAQLV